MKGHCFSGAGGMFRPADPTALDQVPTQAGGLPAAKE